MASSGTPISRPSIVPKYCVKESGDVVPKRARVASPAFSQAADAMKLPLKIIRDTFADKRTAYEAKLILVRPDHFVAWCANQAPADGRATLRKTIGSD